MLQFLTVILIGGGFVLAMGVIALIVEAVSRNRYQREALPPPSRLCERRQPEAVGRVE